MAKSYYGYSERDLDRYTDWAEVSKTISDSLDKEVAERRKLKTELDAQLNKDMTALNNAPQSEHAGTAEQVADYTSGAQTLLLGLDRDFKAGKIKYSDYVARTNNLRNGTEIVYSKTKEFSAMYDEVRKRSISKNGAPADGAYQEQWQAAMLQSYLDPTTTKLVIDPNTFRVNVGKKRTNPKTGLEEVGEFQPVASLYTRLNQKVNNFKLDQLKEDMGGLGQVIMTMRTKGGVNSAGQVMSVEDVLAREEGKAALSNYVDSQMSPDNKSSILTNWIRVNPKTGKSFDFTMDATEAAKDPNKILLALDPQNKSSGKLIAQPSKEQTELVRDWLTEQAKAQLKHVEKRDIYNEPTESAAEREARAKAASGKKKLTDNVNAIADLYKGGDDAVITYASNYFKGINPNIAEITRTDNGVQIIMKDGNSSTLPFYSSSGKPLALYDFIKSATELTGEGDINEAIKNSNAGKNIYQPTKTGTTIVAKKNTPDIPMSQAKTDIMSDKSPTILEKAKGDIKAAYDSGVNNDNVLDEYKNAINSSLAYLPVNKRNNISVEYVTENINGEEKNAIIFKYPKSPNKKGSKNINDFYWMKSYEDSSPESVTRVLNNFYDRVAQSGNQELPNVNSGGSSKPKQGNYGNSAKLFNSKIK